MPKKHLFHFNVGNSTSGPIGMCCSISAATREAALNRLKRLLPEDIGIDFYRRDLKRDAAEPGEYVRVYFNTRNIHTRDIDEIT